MQLVTVLNSNRRENKILCNLLEKNNYRTYKVFSIAELEKALNNFESLAVVMDIDAIPLTKNFIKQLIKNFPGIKVLSLSKSKFHPDLQDIISHHIYACLSKPIDSEELLYLLESIERDEGPSTPRNNLFGA